MNAFYYSLSYSLSYQSSELDWCEQNYIYSNNIVEFWNTISSFAFFMILFWINMKHDKLNTVIICFLGVSSAYFHATLSLFGQILDELSITIIIVKTIFKFNHIYDNTSIRQKILIYAFLIFQLYIQFIYPGINRFALLLYIIIFALKYKKILKIKDHKYNYPTTIQNILDYWYKSLVYFIFAITCWILDFTCITFYINFHTIWHVLIVFSIFNIMKCINNYEQLLIMIVRQSKC